ncbi:Hsp20/alpha crystallin family protein [Sphingobium tyrosinilyticum]
MAMRDLVPWRRQENMAPAMYQQREQSPFAQLHREMDRLFDDFFRTPMLSGGALSSPGWPSLEVKESEDQVTITAELPGLNEKDIELSIYNGVLTLKGEKKSEHQDKDRGWSERFYGRFDRSIVLPMGADEEHCDAHFSDGVLTVRLPKSEATEKERRIPIGSPPTQH